MLLFSRVYFIYLSISQTWKAAKPNSSFQINKVSWIELKHLLWWCEAELKETLSGLKVQQGILNSHSAPPGDCCIYRYATVTLNCTLLYHPNQFHLPPFELLSNCFSLVLLAADLDTFLQQKCILSGLSFSVWIYLQLQKFGCSDSETSRRDNAAESTFHVFNLQQWSEWSCE